MIPAKLDRIPSKNLDSLPGLAKTEVLDVEKTPPAFLVFSAGLALAGSIITGAMPLILLTEMLNTPSVYTGYAISAFIGIGTIKGTTLLSRLYQRNAVCLTLDEKYGDGTSERYKLKLFRHTLKTKETVLPVQYGRYSKDKSQLVQTKLITDWKGIQVKTTIQEEPLAIWDKNASMVKKVYGCKPLILNS